MEGSMLEDTTILMFCNVGPYKSWVAVYSMAPSWKNALGPHTRWIKSLENLKSPNINMFMHIFGTWPSETVWMALNIVVDLIKLYQGGDDFVRTCVSAEMHVYLFAGGSSVRDCRVLRWRRRGGISIWVSSPRLLSPKTPSKASLAHIEPPSTITLQRQLLIDSLRCSSHPPHPFSSALRPSSPSQQQHSPLSPSLPREPWSPRTSNTACLSLDANSIVQRSRNAARGVANHLRSATSAPSIGATVLNRAAHARLGWRYALMGRVVARLGIGRCFGADRKR